MSVVLSSGPARELPTQKTISKRVTAVPRRSAVVHTAAPEVVAAAKAKAHFLQLLDEVERERRPITITKRGRVVAQLMPATEQKSTSAFDQVFGSMKGSARVLGDIVSSDLEAWEEEWQ